MPPKKTYENGIGQLKGHHTIADWRAMLNEMVDQVEAVGVTHIKGTNVYLNPADKNGSPVFPRQYGRRLISAMYAEIKAVILRNATPSHIYKADQFLRNPRLRTFSSGIAFLLYFGYRRNIEGVSTMPKQDEAEVITRYADMFSAMGTEPRLKIMRLLLSAYPEGMIVGEIGSELEIPNSTLSHHLEKLKNEDLVKVRREGTFLWYSANADTLEELLGFLYAECCTRNKAISPQKIVCCK